MQLTDTNELATRIRARLEEVIAPDGPQTLSNYVSDDVRMARALLGVLGDLVRMQKTDSPSAAKTAIESIAEELGVLEDSDE